MAAEFSGWHAAGKPERAVEIREVAEPDIEGDLADGSPGFQELSAGFAQAQVGQVGLEGFAHQPPEKPAESSRTQADEACRIRLGNRATCVCGEIRKNGGKSRV